MRSKTFAIVGGGPAGLFLSRLIKLQNPDAPVTVYERNAPDATFGFGVVFSDRTMSAFERADPETYVRLREASVHWTDMELRHRGQSLRYGGYGFTAISRRTLLRILQEQATAVGADLRFHHDVPHADELGDASVVAIADGANSVTRRAYSAAFGTSVDASGPKFIWFGTPACFDQVTFPFVESRFGPFAAHAYPYESGTSTFIVETDTATWRAAGMDVSTGESRTPGGSDTHSQGLLEEVFKEHLDGHPLLINNSKWASFQVVHNRNWSHRNMVLLGDAAHTAHFSVGSGTKMAMEDAIALAEALGTGDTTADAFHTYETQRRPAVQRTQDWAAPSMRWWATFGQRLHMEPTQFGFHFLTRTGAISYAGLKRRHATRIDEVESWFVSRSAHGGQNPSGPSGLAISTPLTVGEIDLANRIATVASPDTGEGQRRAVESSAQAGSGLVIMDWTTADAPHRFDGVSEPAAWQTSMGRTRDHRAHAMVLLRAGDVAGAAFAQAAGVRLIEWVLPTTAIGTSDNATALQETRQEDSTVIVGVACPQVPAWSTEGENFVQWCSDRVHADVDGVHLRLSQEELTTEGWKYALDYADRIRERSRKPVLLDGPDGWALTGPDSHRIDSWRTRIHTALLSGRLDIVVAQPISRP